MNSFQDSICAKCSKIRDRPDHPSGIRYWCSAYGPFETPKKTFPLECKEHSDSKHHPGIILEFEI